MAGFQTLRNKKKRISQWQHKISVLFYKSLKFNQRINFCLNPRLRKRDLTKQ